MKSLWMSLLLLMPVSAFCEESMTLCIEDQKAAPYTFPTKDGTMQILIKMAAKQVNVPVTFKVMPWKKCIEETRASHLSGLVNAGFTPFHTEYAKFPQLGDGTPDSTAALASMDVLVYHMRGGTPAWDGKKFTGLTKPVLIPSGFASISDPLKKMNVSFDDVTKEPVRNLYKMIAGQGDLVLGFDIEMNKLIATHKDIQDKVEVLPNKFMTADYYVAFSKAYYDANKQKVDALWKAIGQIKKTKEYQDAIKDIAVD